MPRITVAVCTYDRYPHLERVLTALTRQTLPPDDYRIIVVDNSPDRAKAATTPAAKASAPPSGKWRIQLGAFSQRKSAESLYSRLSGKLGGRQAYYVPVGSVVRLQAGPYESRAAASSACARLAPQPCFPVEGR